MLGTPLSPLRGSYDFEITNHGLQPWLHSVAANAAEGALQFIHTLYDRVVC